MKSKLSISHLAWSSNNNEKTVNILKLFKVKYIDIVLSKYFPNLENIKRNKLISIKNYWKKHSINIYGMQSILFGYENLNIFQSKFDRKKLLYLFKKINFAAKTLGIKKITFGCPKNRIINKNKYNENLAINFFRDVSLVLTKNITLCIEPIPMIYGNNFLTTTRETADFVKKVNRKNIKLQLDTSCIKINNENLTDIITEYKNIVGHIHISEKNLTRIRSTKLNYRLIKNIYEYFPSKIITIEILNKSNIPSKNISLSLKFCKSLL
jgi:D-psicose/D-tagatose/L-ribulose 3-epimerase